MMQSGRAVGMTKMGGHSIRVEAQKSKKHGSQAKAECVMM